MTNKNNAIAASAGEAAARETRSRQTHAEAERRAQNSRSNTPAKLKQNDTDEAMPVEASVVEPDIGADVPVSAALEIISGALYRGGGRVGRRAPGESPSQGSGDFLADRREDGDDTIIGSGDRAHEMALKNAFVPFSPRPAPIGRAPLLPVLRPTSWVECGRRCGKAGFCDPSSELGCGGEYCGNHYPALSEPEILPVASTSAAPARRTRDDEQQEIE